MSNMYYLKSNIHSSLDSQEKNIPTYKDDETRIVALSKPKSKTITYFLNSSIFDGVN